MALQTINNGDSGLSARGKINGNFTELNNIKEDTANKATTMTGNEASDTKFLSAKAIYTWVTNFFTNILLLSESLYMLKTKYICFATSQTADNIGDTRISNINGIQITETCTVANATKFSGTWVKSKILQTISLVDNNNQWSGSVPQTSNAFIALDSGKSGMGKIIIGNNQELAYFSFTTNGIVTLDINSANVVTTATDGKLVIIDGGTLVYIVNELGSTLTATLEINYNS